VGSVWQDLRYGLRTLGKSPGFTAFAVAALALGIASSTAIFSLADAVLLRALPYHDAGRLVMIWEDGSAFGFPRQPPAPGNFASWRSENDVFSGMAAVAYHSFALTGQGQPQQLPGSRVTTNLFSVLGVKPALGRGFLPTEGKPGTGYVAVLSHGLWLRDFGGDPRAVGRKIRLNGETYTVAGVMPAGFQFPDRNSELWVPAMFPAKELENRDHHYLQVVARLRAGVSLRQANAHLALLAGRLEREYPDTNAETGTYAVPLREVLAGDLRPVLVVLLGAVAFVLLIACANVASLLLARAAGRRRELAMRIALGAGRGRMVRQLLTESLLLAVIAGCAGWILALWGERFLSRLVPAGIPPPGGSGLDVRVLGFTLVVTVATGVLFGTAPALRASRLEPAEALREGGGRGGVGAGGGRARDVLVAGEVALALILLTGATLMIRSFVKLRGLDPGFRPAQVLALRTSLPSPAYDAPARRNAFYQQVLERVSGLPGVVAAAYTTWLPMTNPGGARGIIIDGRPEPPPDQQIIPNVRMISRDYFRALGIPLVAGRLFDSRDGAGAPLAGVINRTMAQRFWAGASPLGARISFGDYGSKFGWITIVGVVGDVAQGGPGVPSRPAVYLPYAQQDFFPPQYLAVRTRGDPMLLADAVRRQIWAVDPDQPVTSVMPLEAVLADRLAPRVTETTLLGTFAALALLLAGLGIYAVLGYAVAQRTQEIGVRVALGAQRSDVLRLVLGHGLRLVLAGVGIGVAGSLALARVLGHLLYGVSATDPASYAGVALLLTLVALLACYVPARRALRVDPMIALRYE
jgi:predicted permease